MAGFFESLLLIFHSASLSAAPVSGPLPAWAKSERIRLQAVAHAGLLWPRGSQGADAYSMPFLRLGVPTLDSLMQAGPESPDFHCSPVSLYPTIRIPF